MQCHKCGIELSDGTEQKLGLCGDCAYQVIASKRIIDEVNATSNEDDVVYPTKYSVITALNFIAKLVIICAFISAAFFLFSIFVGVEIGKCIIWIVCIALSSTLTSALLMAVSEILNTLYDIRDKI